MTILKIGHWLSEGFSSALQTLPARVALRWQQVLLRLVDPHGDEEQEEKAESVLLFQVWSLGILRT